MNRVIAYVDTNLLWLYKHGKNNFLSVRGWQRSGVELKVGRNFISPKLLGAVSLLKIWQVHSKSRNCPYLLEPEISLPHSQVPQPLLILRQISLVHSFSSYLMKIHLNIILPAKPRYFKWSYSLRSTYQNPVGLCSASPVSHTCHMPRPSRPSWFDHPNIWWGMQSMHLLIM